MVDKGNKVWKVLCRLPLRPYDGVKMKLRGAFLTQEDS